MSYDGTARRRSRNRDTRSLHEQRPAAHAGRSGGGHDAHGRGGSFALHDLSAKARFNAASFDAAFFEIAELQLQLREPTVQSSSVLHVLSPSVWSIARVSSAHVAGIGPVYCAGVGAWKYAGAAGVADGDTLDAAGLALAATTGALALEALSACDALAALVEAGAAGLPAGVPAFGSRGPHRTRAIGNAAVTTRVARATTRLSTETREVMPSLIMRAARHMQMKTVYVDRVKRFSLDVDEATGRTFVAIAVANSRIEYDEWYEVDRETFDRYKADPTLAHDFVAKAKRRELDHLLLLKPGAERGVPE